MDITVEVDTSQIDSALKKAEEFHEILKKAKTLADELANIEVTISTT